MRADRERAPKGGDKFEQLYLRYRQLLYAVAMKILGHPQDAEDAVQQGFLSVYQNLPILSPASRPHTMAVLILIAEPMAIDILRATATAGVELEDDLPGLQIPPPGEGALGDALLQLGAGSREALLLRYYMGYSTREVAQILGMSESAAGKLLWRAKGRLKALLEEGTT
ncbi:MAG: sigma-70 family RNA polymerase sigma factor [Oscillospiraceae bacterium]|nr:sigma-70 family RNA polymerase sigma factor [Oscillospiraceae bacterium]